MNRKRTAAVLGAAVAASLTAVPAADARTRTVRIQGLDFSPATISIKRGDTVVWRFLDRGIQHTVTSRRFRSSRLQSRGTHRVRFTRRGTFRYVCTVHGTMRGKVVVR